MSNETAQDIMVPIDMISVSIEEEAENASRKVLHSGRSAIVETEGEPSAILSLKGSRRLLHQPGTLSEHYPHLRVIGQALSNATIPDLALAMAFDPTIDAFVVLDANKPVGLITMHRLFRVVGWLRPDYIHRSVQTGHLWGHHLILRENLVTVVRRFRIRWRPAISRRMLIVLLSVQPTTNT
jgi:hypothetical protein